MQRDLQVSFAIRWCVASVAWAAIVGAIAVVGGFAAGAIALVGFGADSITDGLASAVLVWRFGNEKAGQRNVERIERRAARVVGAILIAIGLYVSVSAILALAGHSAPRQSTVGLVLTAASVLVLPVLARAKLRLAGALQSSALRGDGVLSLAGAALAAVTLVSLALYKGLGWWWSDAIAALLIGTFLLREGWRTANPSRRLDGWRRAKALSTAGARSALTRLRASVNRPMRADVDVLRRLGPVARFRSRSPSRVRRGVCRCGGRSRVGLR